MNECPSTSPLSFPKARDKTDKNNKLETNGDKIYENKKNVPVEINSMIVNGESGLILLKIAHLIGEDELENIDLDSLNFIVGILNELNTINLRNEILLSVLPLKV